MLFGSGKLTALLVALLATSAATSSEIETLSDLGRYPVGMLEGLCTEIAQFFMRTFDPSNISYSELRLTSHKDNDLFFIFRDAQISNFSDLVITHFSPKIEILQFLFSVQLDKLVARADNYTTEGTLNGKPYAATGSMDFIANDLEATLGVTIDTIRFTPFYLCLAKGSLRVDLSGKSFEANFENADDLNEELNTYGAELVTELQDKIRGQADNFLDWMNDIFCTEM